MKQVDRKIAPPITDYGRLELPRPVERCVVTQQGGFVRVKMFDRCPEPVCRVTVSWPEGLIDANQLSVSMLCAPALKEGAGGMTSSQIANGLEGNGAWLAADTVQEYTFLHLYALNRRIEPVLDVMRRMIVAPAFTDARIDALKKRKVEAMELNRRKVAYMAGKALRRLMCGEDHRRSRQVAPEDILAVTHEDLMSYWGGVMERKAPTVWVSGRVTDDVVKAVEEFASQLPVGACAQSVPAFHLPYRPELPERVVTHIEGVRQAAIAMGMPVPAYGKPSHMGVRLATMALGGYFGSRLNANIREEKGLTYGIGASLNMSPQGAYLEIQAQADEAYVEQVVEETAHELRRLVTEPPTDDEMLALRRIMKTRLAGMLDSPFSTLDYWLALQRTGADADYFGLLQEALCLTGDDIAQAARQYLDPDRLSVSIAKM